ncbi:hypothetical protein EVAR_84121_1 [Eumeta japonica]|uniref:Uncharacterized protein n=1 Tax=Eumeta variegata TaxID=151549 RepID=A0A4C1UYZ1_EUMVA|nr:hypothetical protein EVAR_84121_1 [Eumeta japonica]
MPVCLTLVLCNPKCNPAESTPARCGGAVTQCRNESRVHTQLTMRYFLTDLHKKVIRCENSSEKKVKNRVAVIRRRNAGFVRADNAVSSPAPAD